MTRRAALVTLAGALALSACGNGDTTSDLGGEDTGTNGTPAQDETGAGEDEGTQEATGDPISVGLVTSTSGLLANYGRQFTEGFNVGLDYATGGTMAAGGHPIEVDYQDDASDPARATAAVTSLVGEGTTIITGPVSSGVAMQVAPLAEQNQFLFISGAAATDGVTGVNEFTFRSGRQTYQDVVTAGSIVGDLADKKVVVFAQDYEFGQANVAAVQAVLGDEGGADVVPILSPVQTSDFTPFARQVIDADPDLVFVAWAGDTTAAMWQSLDQQGVFDSTEVVTGLADRASFDSFGPAATRISFLSHYFAEATDNEANQALVSGLEAEGIEADIFHNDGFVAAQMVVRAIEETGGEDVSAMISALEGWTFTGPKGESTVRAEDHALLQPMFTAHLAGEVGSLIPEADSTLSPDDTAPPVAQ